MATKTYYLSKGDIKLSEHFNLSEFQCHDGTDKIILNPELINVLERLYAKLGAAAINITSGYRTPSHSVSVGGYSTDQHTQGNAADITVKRKAGSLFTSTQIVCALEDLNHQGGIGRINTTESVHVDVRGYKCWFDECANEKIIDSWYDYLRIRRPSAQTNTATQGAGKVLAQGVDLSEFQTGLDYKKILAAGYTFAILRAGFGKYASQKDAAFETHYRGAVSAGMRVGAYWYSYATDKAGAKQEAETFLAVIKGKSFDLPLWLDLEEEKQFKLGKGAVSAMIRAFLTELKAAGYKCGLYMSSYYLNNYVEDDILKAYPIWVADYTGSNGFKGTTAIWQYASNGKVNGYNGNLDVNRMYVDLIEKKTLTGNEQVYTVNGGDTWESVGKKYGVSGIALLLYNNYKTANGTTAKRTITQKTVRIPAKWVSGDVDGDGKVTSADARKALRAAAKLTSLSPVETMRADVNGDGRVTASDARTILKTAGKLI